MNGPSVSARAGRTRWALCSQMGMSSRTCLSTSAAKASPTRRVVSSSPMVRTLKLNRTTHRSASTGVVTARLIVSTIPLKLTTEMPGPQAWLSMRPSTTPRGVGNFCEDRMTASGNPVVYSSSSGTVAVLWT